MRRWREEHSEHTRAYNTAPDVKERRRTVLYPRMRDALNERRRARYKLLKESEAITEPPTEQ
jgi:hypothetical protein